MQDILYVGITIGFFAVCVAYVRGLDRLVRGTVDNERDADVGEPAEWHEGELTEVRL